MEKELAITEFINGFRAAVNNSLAYSKGHPYFSKTAQELNEKIENLFVFLSPITIKISPDSLFLDGINWNKVNFSRELAKLLHQRKVKSVEFKPGLSDAELEDFLSLLALRPRELFKKGSLSALIRDARLEHVLVEDLDYSGLLGSGGEEAKDIWTHIFKDAVQKQDGNKINEFADRLLKGTGNISLKAVIEDESLRKALVGFLKYLKASKQENHAKCFKELSGMLLASGSQFSLDNADKLKELFKDFDGNDFADALLSQLSTDKPLGALNMGLFTRLAGEKNAGQIASSVVEKVEKDAALKNSPILINKLKDLLLSPDTSSFSSVYLNSLASLVKSISFTNIAVFDRQQLCLNYRMILLNLLSQEKAQKELELILERLNNELEAVFQENDFVFLRHLLDILQRIDRSLGVSKLADIENRIYEFLEKSAWEGGLPEEMLDLVSAFGKSSVTADFYLNKIFRENKLSVYGFKLFFEFFPAELKIFYKNLQTRRSDLEFLSKAIGILAGIDLPVSLSVLKEIFSLSNDLIKIEALKAMQVNPGFDAEFIFPLLKNKNYTLRKEAAAVLNRDNIARSKAVDLLLDIASPFGISNKLLLENISIVEELKIKEAQGYLRGFSQKRFFWNWELRDKALRALESLR